MLMSFRPVTPAPKSVNQWLLRSDSEALFPGRSNLRLSAQFCVSASTTPMEVISEDISIFDSTYCAPLMLFSIMETTAALPTAVMLNATSAPAIEKPLLVEL
jgi:hypothetical protein